MNNRLPSALICVLDGILYMAVPHGIFPVCGHAGAPAGIASLAGQERAAPASAIGHGRIALPSPLSGAEFSDQRPEGRWLT
jgi:hypothetical protein